MTKLTKAQLVDENITLRAQYEVLLTKYEATQNALRNYQQRDQARTDAPVPSFTPLAAPAYKDGKLSHYERLIQAGMPRKFAYGREVMPTQAQLAYWTNRTAN